MRIAAAAAGVAATLVLTGCSSDGGDGGGADKSSDTSSSASASASASPDSGDGSGGGGGSGSSGGGLEGSWLATTDGKAVALVINGKQAGLFTSGGTVCHGTAGEQAGMQMIALTCTGGNDDRSEGMVGSVTDATLKVTWEGGLGEEIYRRAEGGKLPEGLPTASLSAS
ncbi:hypothetical protein H1V43_21465 [Streptomyces sp. PSKA54]|uniref:Lipoprotein n=1 Tax=Streptomyces himalayensis subsp. aureolus TaxID=2758039 RepID=A0A7W2HHL2_9ACTN|nr:hypothetical protein [Streptomyces himalayensis]MBA4863879.1 hypothetical protein [Streptomyces himalayensis subsp. aureolus]